MEEFDKKQQQQKGELFIANRHRDELSINVFVQSLCLGLVYIHSLLANGPIFSTKLPPSPTIEIFFYSPSDSNSP